MSVYFIANLKIHDRETYQKYVEGTHKAEQDFKGKFLVIDEQPELLEGQWDYSRVVIIEFPDKEAFEGWYYSTAYREIIDYRLSSAECDVIVARGK